ncbi:aldo/keto reductase [Lachnospiraceae bacterium MD1]|uniref:Aldo/keto reductase n=1 Tax=Variimorphobacter saccharofermentans TaxID=2755051 RepID=A0A839K7N2_9FIRM|nr:aldo/keto reductase [Variimorphobacter saccharofermentans]MBB2184651.1 aldo/keto reductase [Variimorphobacter saccharofermentans]
MEQRVLGRSGIKVSPMGLGSWAIGGQFYMDNKIDGYGETDDRMSIAAIQTALDLGINFIDTSDSYGIGHSEQLIGEAIKGRRSEIVLATKFGYIGSEATKTLHGYNVSPDYIERACDASLKRLQTDYIDLYQLHVWEISLSEIESVIPTLEKLVSKGKIRTYGWSTDLTSGAKLFAEQQNCSAIQQQLNILEGNQEITKLCEEKGLASINRSPLAMGFLSGKFKRDTTIPKDDVRGAGHSWVGIFKDGKPNPAAYDKLTAIRDILTTGGRTLVQGSLAWIWAKSGVTIPIPGFKTVEQIKENAKAMEFGPLSQDQMMEIDKILKSMD